MPTLTAVIHRAAEEHVMGKTITPLRRAGAVTGGAALLLAVGAVTAASAEPDDQPIRACLHTGVHGRAAVRLVSDFALCRAGETTLSWNQAGPSGPPGEPGTPGTPGADAIKLFASIAADGSVINSSSTVLADQFTGKFNNSTGAYQVHFSRFVTGCVATASAHADGAFDSAPAFATVGFT